MTKEIALTELLNDLHPEELEPRLELQVLIDPLGAVTTADDNNCGAGGNCNVLPE